MQINKYTNKQINKSITNYQLPITASNIRKGLESAYIPGRLEIIRKHPTVILDGAHNGDKIKALVKAVKEIFPNKGVTVILAIKKEKNAREMIKHLLAITDEFILTEFKLKGDLGVIRSYDCTDLEQIIQLISSGRSRFATPSGWPEACLPDRQGLLEGELNRISRNSCTIKVVKDPLTALNTAIREAQDDSLILATGSLYLIGEIFKKN